MPLTCKVIDEEEAGLHKYPPAPAGVPAARWDRGSVGPALAWYRGKHAGWIEAVLALQEMGQKKAAEKLQNHFRLNDDGSITL